MIAEYQKDIDCCWRKIKAVLKRSNNLNNHVDSLILIEYPKINQFISDVFRLGFD